MDNGKFVKALKTLGWLDNKKLTSTDADLAFTKAKAKGERKIDFEQFRAAVAKLGQKKFPKDENPLISLLQSAKMPKQQGTQAENLDVVDRLTNARHYTGAHRSRFDAEGKGKGLEGRDSNRTGKGHTPARRVMAGGSKVELSDTLRGEATGEDKDKTECSKCGTKKTLTQRSCSFCGTEFF